jgi:hypothetical protein
MKYYLHMRNDRSNPRGLKITQGKKGELEEEKYEDVSSEEDEWQDEIEEHESLRESS